MRASLVCLLFAGIGALADVPPSGYLHLTLLSDTLPAEKGGRCMDGSMTGYYYRKGVPDTYVIFIEGGGGCSSEGDAPTIQRLKICWMKGRACVAPRSDQS